MDADALSPEIEAVNEALGDPFRFKQEPLTEAQRGGILAIKLFALSIAGTLSSFGEGREKSIAKKHLEDAVMRGVRHITRPDQR